MAASFAAIAILGDLVRVLLVLPRVEIGRRQTGPGPLLRNMRDRGLRRGVRTDAERVRLRQTIFAIDKRLPDGGNCYRRALLEVALDPDAAKAPFFMGLQSSGERKSGHAWLGYVADDDRPYDAVVTL